MTALLEYTKALEAATLPETPTDQADERHDVPSVAEGERTGCEEWLREVRCLPRATNDEIWERVKKNWIAVLAATCRIEPTKVAPLAPDRKLVRFTSGSGEEGETPQKRKRRFQQDQRQRMTIQASFWKHLDGLEGLTERWPQKALVVMKLHGRRPGRSVRIAGCNLGSWQAETLPSSLDQSRSLSGSF
ncbi:hypothetical protein ACKAV7_000017 [Fusarium commune]